MDDIDINLLTAMEEDARISLKNLAGELGIKTSTIYHRLHKLRERKILDRFTIVINPPSIGLNLQYLVTIQAKTMAIGEFDAMFLESFGNYLAEKYDEVALATVGDDGVVYLITAFRDEDHLQDFKEELAQNPYVNEIQYIELKKLLKGKRLFRYVAPQLEPETQGELFDDLGADEEIDLTPTEFEFQF